MVHVVALERSHVLTAKKQGGYKQNGLRDADEKYILDQRYMVWGQKYEQRATWML